MKKLMSLVLVVVFAGFLMACGGDSSAVSSAKSEAIHFGTVRGSDVRFQLAGDLRDVVSTVPRLGWTVVRLTDGLNPIDAIMPPSLWPNPSIRSQALEQCALAGARCTVKVAVWDGSYDIGPNRPRVHFITGFNLAK